MWRKCLLSSIGDYGCIFGLFQISQIIQNLLSCLLVSLGEGEISSSDKEEEAIEKSFVFTFLDMAK